MTSDGNGTAWHDPDTFDVRGSLRALTDATRDNKRLVGLICAICVGLMALYIYVWPPIYRAEALLKAERDVDPSRDSFYSNWAIFRKDDAKSEIELMTSGPILKAVIEKEHLRYDDVYHPMMAELTYLWQKSWVGKHYHDLKRQLFPDPDESAASPEEIELGKTIAGLGAGISIDPVGESNVGRLRMKGPNRRVAGVANTLLDTYMAKRSERYRNEAKNSYDLLSAETQAASKELDVISARRMAFAVANRITLEFSKEAVQIGKLAEWELEVASARAKIAGMEASLREVEKELAAEPQSRTLSTVFEMNTLRESVKAKRMDLMTSLAQTLGRYREDSPEVQDIRAEIARLDVIIGQASDKVEKSTTEALNENRTALLAKRDNLRADLEGSRAGLAQLEQTVSKLSARMDTMPVLQTQMRALDRELMLAQEKYQQLAVKRTQAAVSEATSRAAMPSLYVVEYAVPGDKTWPKTQILYPAAALVGLLLGMIVAAIKEYLSGRIGKRDLGNRNYRVYGTVRIPLRQRVAVVPRGAAGPDGAAEALTGK